MMVWKQVLLLLAAAPAAIAFSADAQDYAYGLDEEGQRNFGKFLEAPNHKAFAIGSNGAFGWRSNRQTVQEAIEQALANCRPYSRVDCQLVQIDDQRVVASPPPQSYGSPGPSQSYGRPPARSSEPPLSHLQQEALGDGCRLRYSGNAHKYKDCLNLGANWQDALAQGCQARYSGNSRKLRECMSF